MKSIFLSLCVLPIVVYAGGDLLVPESNYDESSIADEKVVVEVIPPEVEKKVEVVKKVAVQAPKNYYAGLSVASMDIDTTTNTLIVKNTKPIMLTGKLGYNVTDYLALEGRASVGIKKEVINTLATSKLDKSVGIYVKPNIELMKNVNAYGLLGYAKSKHQINDDSLITDGFSYGLGVGYTLTDAWDVVIDAVRYANENQSTVDAYSVGVNYNF